MTSSSGKLARAFWIVGPGRAELREAALPALGENELRVRTLYSAISRGTESLVFEGKVPPSERERMRAPFQEGDFPAPVKYGYSNVGEVEAGPDDLLGETVFCLFPHQTRYVVPTASVVPVPHDVPPARAVLAANLETAINAAWDAAPAIGDRIAVVGAGAVGCLVGWLLGAIPGTEVELVDSNPARAEVASTLGVDFATPERARREADLVVHASGSPVGLATALELAAFEATVLEMSWYGTQEVPVPLGGAFHSRRLLLRSSQVGHVATVQRARWDYRRRVELALRLLAEPALDVLITGESDFDDLPATMARLAATGGDTLCHRIRYP